VLRRGAALGYLLFSVGGASVAFSGGRYAVGEWRGHDARQAWEESNARDVVALARRSLDGEVIAGEIAPGSPVARLVIPRLQLDEIVFEGVHDDALNAGPGHLTGSAFPGEAGNSVISAHRDRHFSRLGEIEVGDTIATQSGARNQRWVVISKRVIDADAPALFRTRDATLTLSTCWPIRYFGPAPSRLIVTAKPVRENATRAAKTPSFATDSDS
jgi:LPXTG-site transpeptidase (sortase) family protein